MFWQLLRHRHDEAEAAVNLRAEILAHDVPTNNATGLCSTCPPWTFNCKRPAGTCFSALCMFRCTSLGFNKVPLNFICGSGLEARLQVYAASSCSMKCPEASLLTCRAPLQLADIWELPPDDRVGHLAGRFRPVWADEQQRRGGPSLVGLLVPTPLPCTPQSHILHWN